VLVHSCCRVEVTEQVNQREKVLNTNACWGERVLARDMNSLQMVEEHVSEKDLEEIWSAPSPLKFGFVQLEKKTTKRGKNSRRDEQEVSSGWMKLPLL
jgi:hypothetical protein